MVKTVQRHSRRVIAVSLVAILLGCNSTSRQENDAARKPEPWEQQLDDASNGDDWPAFGRTYGEQHYSPLTDINLDNVKDLGLV